MINYLPLKDESKRSNSSGGKGVPIDNKDVVAHSPVKGDFGNYVHASITELKRDHGYVWLNLLNEITETSNFSFHFVSFL